MLNGWFVPGSQSSQSGVLVVSEGWSAGIVVRLMALGGEACSVELLGGS